MILSKFESDPVIPLLKARQWLLLLLGGKVKPLQRPTALYVSFFTVHYIISHLFPHMFCSSQPCLFVLLVSGLLHVLFSPPRLLFPPVAA